MKTLTATYRIVTPMFLGGANPESQAELRISSIKGALRFWWRALMWGR
ncbi:MAG TPA: type III-B CRISPR module RAMP protein Cmr1, partial [Verrucomicrobiota bacterium]|nr:type III-B CRISPR module RAMP protein Cmr1 [Verrucomicrobiota bacterium]